MKQVLVACHNELHTPSNCAFQDAVIGLICHSPYPARRAHPLRDFGKPYRDPRQHLAVAAELPGKDPEKFIQKCLGKDEAIFTFHNAR